MNQSLLNFPFASRFAVFYEPKLAFIKFLSLRSRQFKRRLPSKFFLKNAHTGQQTKRADGFSPAGDHKPNGYAIVNLLFGQALGGASRRPILGLFFNGLSALDDSALQAGFLALREEQIRSSNRKQIAHD